MGKGKQGSNMEQIKPRKMGSKSMKVGMRKGK